MGVSSNHLAHEGLFTLELLFWQQEFVLQLPESNLSFPAVFPPGKFLPFFAVWMSRTLESQTCSKDALPTYKHRRKCRERAHKFQVSANWLYPRDLRARDWPSWNPGNRVGRSFRPNCIKTRENKFLVSHVRIFLRLSFSHSSYTNLIHLVAINLRGAHKERKKVCWNKVREGE